MTTLLNDIPLGELLKQPILFDANIFMVGIENRSSDPNCSFENMKQVFILPILESFEKILIHEEVYKELDIDAKTLIDSYRDKNVKVVFEGNLYGKDPKYTSIFADISGHDLVLYDRKRSKDRGEVFSLAYAAYHGVNYFCSKEVMVDLVARELPSLRDVNIVTFDIIILTAFVYYARLNDTSKSKALKSLYKRYCSDVIRRHHLPGTLSEYIREVQKYL